MAFVKEDNTPVNGDRVGALNFQVDDGGVFVTYGAIRVTNIDVTDNAVMDFELRANN